MLYRYKEASSLRDEIGMLTHISRNRCNGQVTIFVRPYHVREEDKKVIDKEMKCLCYLGI